MSKKINWSELTRQYYTKVGEHFDFSPMRIGGATLTENILQEAKGNLSEMEISGSIEEDEKDEDGLRYLQKIEKLGGRLLHKWMGNNFSTATFLFDHGIVRIEVSINFLKAHAISTDEKFVTKLQKEISSEFLPDIQEGHIFAIVRQGQNLNISSIGNASVPLVVGNYTKTVLTDYKYAIKDLKTANPSGRIVIMEGEPGTGKTHLIRALLTEVLDAMFVLISPEMVPSLAGPDLLPLLLQNKQAYALNGPIVLVLEDADRCLITRGGDNINSIQSLLNLGDGIVGSLLDLRIVATTNAKKLEMEAAILRPGRLSKRMEVGPLDFNTARGVFKRLLPETAYPDKLLVEPHLDVFKMTLAEVYSLARTHGWEPAVRVAKKKNLQKNSAYWDD